MKNQLQIFINYPEIDISLDESSLDELGKLAESINSLIKFHHAELVDAMAEQWNNPYSWRCAEYSNHWLAF